MAEVIPFAFYQQIKKGEIQRQARQRASKPSVHTAALAPSASEELPESFLVAFSGVMKRVEELTTVEELVEFRKETASYLQQMKKTYNSPGLSREILALESRMNRRVEERRIDLHGVTQQFPELYLDAAQSIRARIEELESIEELVLYRKEASNYLYKLKDSFNSTFLSREIIDFVSRMNVRIEERCQELRL